MAETLLRPAQGGGYELCCPPGYEAQVYAYAFGWAMQLELDQVSCPVKVIGSDPTTAFSFMPSLDLSELTVLGYDFLPETTHMLPLEEPERCARLTVEFLQLHNLA
jgi:pimeloyl-ACP methyl ester carboxylesterase